MRRAIDKNIRKSPKKKNGDLLGILIISVIVMLIGITMYAFVSVSSKQIPRDKKTLCRIDGKYDKQIILLDITGKYNLVQHKTIRQAIENQVKTLKKDEQLQLYFITNDIRSGLEPLLSVCNPGTGEDVSGIFANPKMIKQKWENKLYKPIEKLLNNFDKESLEAKSSPIFETIQLINNSMLKGAKEGTTQTMTIISDFIQHSEDYSFLRNKLQNFSTSNYKLRVKTSFDNIKVNLLFIRRNGREEYLSKKYLNFWKDYFLKSGSSDIKIKILEG
ncbi:hypothetical protein MNB_ARC-1_660 [hydrothermal vent metagenome]|uniref:Uncharacterized protein n=1 Tax=hydrothermal vent metagenome TaxID=652676 RepID=A0A3B1DX09_9ZZZZ